MKFELTLYTILVFVVPGALALAAFAFLIPALASAFLAALSAPSASLGILLLSLSFAIGALVDSVRTILLDSLALKLCKYPIPADYLSEVTKDNIGVFQLVLERTQEYYRFNANSTLALLFAEVSFVLARGLDWVLLPASALLLLLFVSAVNAKNSANWAMSQMVKPQIAKTGG